MRERKLVVAALVREEGRILMSRRRADQAMPNLWEFPGGKVEPGEHPEAALVRELREELGCGIEVDRIHEVVFHAYPDFDLYMLVYASRIIGRPARARVEVAEVAWVEPRRASRIARYSLPADYPLAREAGRGAARRTRGSTGRSSLAGAAAVAAARSLRPAAPASRPGPGARSGAPRARRFAPPPSRRACRRRTCAGSAQAPRCVCSWLSGGQ